MTSAIFNDQILEDGPGNFVFNFTGAEAPDTDKYFNVTITQLPTLDTDGVPVKSIIYNLNFVFLY